MAWLFFSIRCVLSRIWIQPFLHGLLPSPWLESLGKNRRMWRPFETCFGGDHMHISGPPAFFSLPSLAWDFCEHKRLAPSRCEVKRPKGSFVSLYRKPLLALTRNSFRTVDVKDIVLFRAVVVAMWPFESVFAYQKHGWRILVSAWSSHRCVDQSRPMIHNPFANINGWEPIETLIRALQRVKERL